MTKEELIKQIELIQRDIMQNYKPAKWQSLAPENTLQSGFETAETLEVCKLVRVIDKHPSSVLSVLDQVQLNEYLNQLKRARNGLVAHFAKFETGG